MSNPQRDTEDSVKRHGDKLSNATGGRAPPTEPPAIAPSEPPLKVHGDKLRDAVDKTRS